MYHLPGVMDRVPRSVVGAFPPLPASVNVNASRSNPIDHPACSCTHPMIVPVRPLAGTLTQVEIETSRVGNPIRSPEI